VTAPLLAIMTPKAFLVLNSTNVLTVHKIIRALMHADVRTTDMGALLVGVLAATIADYEVLIHRTGKYIKDTGHRLRNHEVNNGDFVHFVTVEDNLSEYALNLNEMLVVAERLSENKHFPLKAHEAEALNDTILHTKQLLSSVISLGSTITSIRNAYSTIANNSLNLRMKTLTVLTVLIALPNVFYGMYGMNVPLPFQNAPWAYGAIVIFTFTLILGVYAIAKRFRVF
jgi:magnesium transporter